MKEKSILSLPLLKHLTLHCLPPFEKLLGARTGTDLLFPLLYSEERVATLSEIYNYKDKNDIKDLAKCAKCFENMTISEAV